MKYPDPRTQPARFYDIEQTLDDNRIAAIKYMRAHNWHDLRINKSTVTTGDYGGGGCVRLDCEPEEFMSALIKMHQDYP
jgi:hypothetical protein